LSERKEPFWGTTSHATMIHLFVWDEERQKMVPACRLHRRSRPVPKTVFLIPDCHEHHPGACPDCAKRSKVHLPQPPQKSSISSKS
jgi:hypothetical protein